MARRKTVLGRGELEMLRVVERRQPVTAGDLAREVAQTTGQARTTVSTVLERLRRKGYLARKKSQGRYHYSTRLASRELLADLVGDFVEGTLGGSVSPFFAYLTDQAQLDEAQLRELKQLARQLKVKPEERAP